MAYSGVAAKLSNQRTGTIGRSIIDDKEFPVGIGLPHETVNCAAHKSRLIIGRHQHRNLRPGHKQVCVQAVLKVAHRSACDAVLGYLRRTSISSLTQGTAMSCATQEYEGRKLTRFPHLGSFESTKIHGSGLDVLETTHHIEFWKEDLLRLRDSGIRELRYPVPWHRIERQRGHLDWSWIDGPLQCMRELGLEPILDPMHHVSIPDWLTDGFANSEFADLYVRFIEEVAKRYEWVERYTVLNEPLPTLVLCAFTGDWYPHKRSDKDFVRMAIHVSRAICLATTALKQINSRIQLVHVDACEHHRALDAESLLWVEHVNHRRFLFHDLVLFRIGSEHALLPYLVRHGFTDDDRCWFEDHSINIDVLGLDYYAHSEIEWGWDREAKAATLRFPCRNPRGFAAVAEDYVRRFHLPILLSETNIGGTVTDRLTWLKFMEEQAEKLAAVSDFRGFCWFPSIDATDWDSLCTVANRHVCPMGIWSLTADCVSRSSSELSEWYVKLAQGTASSRDLPAYRLNPPLDRDLLGYQPLMNHWAEWRDPENIALLLRPRCGTATTSWGSSLARPCHGELVRLNAGKSPYSATSYGLAIRARSAIPGQR